MRTSQSSMRTKRVGRLLGDERGAIDHREREHRARRDALLTPCADWRVYKQSALAQVYGAWGTQRHAKATSIAAVRVYDSNLEGSDSRHRERRYGVA